MSLSDKSRPIHTRLGVEALEARELPAILLPLAGDLGSNPGSITRTAAIGDTSAGNKEVDLFRVDLLAGSRVTVATAAAAPGGSTDTYLRVFDAAGLQVAFNDDSGGTLFSSVSLNPTVTGTYYIGVSGYGNNRYDINTGAGLAAGATGAYKLSVSSVPPTPMAVTATLTPGVVPASLTASVNGTEVRLYQVDLKAGAKFTASTSQPTGSASMDTYLRLFDVTGKQIAYNDDAVGAYSRLDFQAVTAGKYFLGVSAYGNHSYEITNGSGLNSRTGGSFVLTTSATGTTTPLVLNAISDQRMTARQVALIIPVTVSNADGNRFTVTAVVPADGTGLPPATVAVAGSTLSITPRGGFVGRFTVDMTVNDGTRTDTKSFAVDVAANRVPTLADISGVTVKRGTNSVRMPFTAADADGDRLTYTSSLDGSTGATVQVIGNEIWLTPPTGYVGRITGRLTVNDGLVSDSKPFTVEVTNAVPTLADIASVTTRPLRYSSQTVEVPFTSSDSDGDTLTYTVALDGGTGATATVSGSSIRLTVPAGYAGSITGRLTASDGAASVIKTFAVELPNATPTLSDLDTVHTKHGTYSVQLPFTGADADGDWLNYSVSLDGNTGATAAVYGTTIFLSPASTFTGRITGRITVTDGIASAAKAFAVELTNEVPVLNDIAAVAVQRGTYLVRMPFAAADGDGDSLTYTASLDGSTGSTVRVIGNEIWLTPPTGYVGHITGRLSVSDGLAADSKPFSVEMTNVAPTLADIEPVTGKQGDQNIRSGFTAFDADGDQLTYTVQFDGGSGATGRVVGSEMWITPPANFTGRLTGTLTASDGVASVSKSFVLDVYAPPSVTLDNVIPGRYSGSQPLVRGRVTAQAGDIVRVTATLDWGQPVELQLTNGQFTFTPVGLTDDNALHGVEIVVTDSVGYRVTLPRSTFYVDTTPATVALQYTISPVVSQNVAVTGRLTDRFFGQYDVYSGAERLIVQLDDGPAIEIQPDYLGYFTYASTFSLDGTADGQHRLRFRATDGAGIVTQSPDVTFILDTQSPKVTLAQTPATLVNGNVSIRGMAIDAGGLSKFQAILDGASAVTVPTQNGTFIFTTAFALDGKADGTHRMKFRATDTAGRVTETAEIVWTMDSVAPAVTLDLPIHYTLNGFAGPIEQSPNGYDPKTNGSMYLRGSVSETGTGIVSAQVILDGQAPINVPITAGKFALAKSVMADGTYYGRLLLTDAAGNVAEYRFRQVFDGLQRVESSIWLPNGILVRDTWDEEGKMSRETFLRGSLVQLDVWGYAGHTTTTWDGLGNQSRKAEQGDRVIVEMWLANGTHVNRAYKKTDVADSRVYLISPQSDGSLDGFQLSEEVIDSADGVRQTTTYHTGFIAGFKSVSVQLNGRLISNELVSPQGGSDKTVFFPDGSSETLSTDAAGHLTSKVEDGGKGTKRRTMFTETGTINRVETLVGDKLVYAEFHDYDGKIIPVSYDDEGNAIQVIQSTTNYSTITRTYLNAKLSREVELASNDYFQRVSTGGFAGTRSVIVKANQTIKLFNADGQLIQKTVLYLDGSGYLAEQYAPVIGGSQLILQAVATDITKYGAVNVMGDNPWNPFEDISYGSNQPSKPTGRFPFSTKLEELTSFELRRWSTGGELLTEWVWEFGQVTKQTTKSETGWTTQEQDTGGLRISLSTHPTLGKTKTIYAAETGNPISYTQWDNAGQVVRQVTYGADGKPWQTIDTAPAGSHGLFGHSMIVISEKKGDGWERKTMTKNMGSTDSVEVLFERGKDNKSSYYRTFQQDGWQVSEWYGSDSRAEKQEFSRGSVLIRYVYTGDTTATIYVYENGSFVYSQPVQVPKRPHITYEAAKFENVPLGLTGGVLGQFAEAIVGGDAVQIVSGNPIEVMKSLGGRISDAYKATRDALGDLVGKIGGLLDAGVRIANTAGRVSIAGVEISIPAIIADPKNALGAIADLGTSFAGLDAKGRASAGIFDYNPQIFGDGVWKELPEFQGTTILDLSTLLNPIQILDRIKQMPVVGDVLRSVEDKITRPLADAGKKAADHSSGIDWTNPINWQDPAKMILGGKEDRTLDALAVLGYSPKQMDIIKRLVIEGSSLSSEQKEIFDEIFVKTYSATIQAFDKAGIDVPTDRFGAIQEMVLTATKRAWLFVNGLDSSGLPSTPGYKLGLREDDNPRDAMAGVSVDTGGNLHYTVGSGGTSNRTGKREFLEMLFGFFAGDGDSTGSGRFEKRSERIVSTEDGGASGSAGGSGSEPQPPGGSISGGKGSDPVTGGIAEGIKVIFGETRGEMSSSETARRQEIKEKAETLRDLILNTTGSKLDEAIQKSPPQIKGTSEVDGVKAAQTINSNLGSYKNDSVCSYAVTKAINANLPTGAVPLSIDDAKEFGAANGKDMGVVLKKSGYAEVGSEAGFQVGDIAVTQAFDGDSRNNGAGRGHVAMFVGYGGKAEKKENEIWISDFNQGSNPQGYKATYTSDTGSHKAGEKRVYKIGADGNITNTPTRYYRP